MRFRKHEVILKKKKKNLKKKEEPLRQIARAEFKLVRIIS